MIQKCISIALSSFLAPKFSQGREFQVFKHSCSCSTCDDDGGGEEGDDDLFAFHKVQTRLPFGPFPPLLVTSSLKLSKSRIAMRIPFSWRTSPSFGGTLFNFLLCALVDDDYDEKVLRIHFVNKPPVLWQSVAERWFDCLILVPFLLKIVVEI